jgi:hypothetical protein
MAEHTKDAAVAAKIGQEKPQELPGIECHMKVKPMYDASWYKVSSAT